MAEKTPAVTRTDPRYGPESRPWEDFAAGVDPTGSATFRYSVRNREDHGKHVARSMAGGFLAGSTLIPAAAFAVLRGAGAKGRMADRLTAAAKGATEPFRRVWQATHGSRALQRAADTGKHAPSEVERKSLRGIYESVVGDTPVIGHPAVAEAVANVKSDKVPGVARKAMGQAADVIRRRRNEGLGYMALGGAINAGAAGWQYRSGQKMQKQLDQQYGWEKEGSIISGAKELAQRHLQTARKRLAARARGVHPEKLRDAPTPGLRGVAEDVAGAALRPSSALEVLRSATKARADAAVPLAAAQEVVSNPKRRLREAGRNLANEVSGWLDPDTGLKSTDEVGGRLRAFLKQELERQGGSRGREAAERYRGLSASAEQLRDATRAEPLLEAAPGDLPWRAARRDAPFAFDQMLTKRKTGS